MNSAPNTGCIELRTAARITLAGRVQGIGMRPAVARFASKLALTGVVQNTRGGVEIWVEGAAEKVERFVRELRVQLPETAEISSWQTQHAEPQNLAEFTIAGLRKFKEVDGAASPEDGPLSARVPPDVAVCGACLAEVRDEENRRGAYPFTSCTDCGPRYSIIEKMPYERRETAMRRFPLCNYCEIEYQSPADRRFHAQTNACRECGPQVWLRDELNRLIAKHADAIRAAAAALRQGQIVALRGLGGYQLLGDATSEQAVARLRRRKRRYGKPLAVMSLKIEHAAQLAHLSDNERNLLTSPANPIVIAARRRDSPLANSVSNNLNTVGLMLPTTPLHALLLRDAGAPLVCTSANVDGDPLVYRSDDAQPQLRDIADVCLEHDRPIRRPVDDSVVRVIANRTVAIRLARGYAPLPLDLPSEGPMIALGGLQKASLALINGAQAVLGSHIGDLNTVASRERFVQQLDAFTTLYGAAATTLTCDQHPDYFTTQWAESQPASVVRVQHHHAHIAAGMLEHGWLDRQVLGVAFDGAGFGADGAVWGGEFLLATATEFSRVGQLRPFPLPGGDRAAVEPWRVAVALVNDAAGADAVGHLCFETANAISLLPVLGRSNLSPLTTSAGRLFDGAAALILGIERISFEGQAAMLLEAACDHSAYGAYALPITGNAPQQADWRPLVREILQDRARGVAPSEMAMRFHRGLACAIARCCRQFAPLPVVLGGGVFQNRVLVELLAEQFAGANQLLGLPGLIPPNDGGLAAGQLAVASARTVRRRSLRCV